MDDLQKLLENAGVKEAVTSDMKNMTELDRLSEVYEFEVDQAGHIDVYTSTNEGVRRIARFYSFDDMLQNFGKM